MDFFSILHTHTYTRTQERKKFNEFNACLCKTAKEFSNCTSVIGRASACSLLSWADKGFIIIIVLVKMVIKNNAWVEFVYKVSSFQLKHPVVQVLLYAPHPAHSFILTTTTFFPSTVSTDLGRLPFVCKINTCQIILLGDVMSREKPKGGKVAGTKSVWKIFLEKMLGELILEKEMEEPLHVGQRVQCVHTSPIEMSCSGAWNSMFILDT